MTSLTDDLEAAYGLAARSSGRPAEEWVWSFGQDLWAALRHVNPPALDMSEAQNGIYRHMGVLIAFDRAFGWELNAGSGTVTERMVIDSRIQAAPPATHT